MNENLNRGLSGPRIDESQTTAVEIKKRYTPPVLTLEAHLREITLGSRGQVGGMSIDERSKNDDRGGGGDASPFKNVFDD